MFPLRLILKQPQSPRCAQGTTTTLRTRCAVRWGTPAAKFTPSGVRRICQRCQSLLAGASATEASRTCLPAKTRARTTTSMTKTASTAASGQTAARELSTTPSIAHAPMRSTRAPSVTTIRRRPVWHWSDAQAAARAPTPRTSRSRLAAWTVSAAASFPVWPQSQKLLHRLHHAVLIRYHELAPQRPRVRRWAAARQLLLRDARVRAVCKRHAGARRVLSRLTQVGGSARKPRGVLWLQQQRAAGRRRRRACRRDPGLVGRRCWGRDDEYRSF